MKFINKLLKKAQHFYMKARWYKVETYIPIHVSGPMPPGANQALELSCGLLEQNGVPFVLAWGTALGLYRDGRLILHDTDIDIDIVDYHDHDFINEIFVNAGMTLARRVFYQKKIQQLVYLSEDGVIVDVVFWAKKGKMLINYCEPGHVLKLPFELLKNKTRINYKDRAYPIPALSEAYLTMLYGTDWRTPKVSKGDWKDDCKVVYKCPERIYRLNKKLVSWYKKRVKRGGELDQHGQFCIPEDFFEINRKFWPRISFSKDFFLVSFLLKDHEYYNVNLISTRGLAEVMEACPVALLHSRKEQELIKLVASYGIHNFIYLEDYKISRASSLWLKFYAIFLWATRRTKRKLLNISYKNKLIGHFIYDTYLGSTGFGTVKVGDYKYAKYIYRALVCYHKYVSIFNTKKFQLFASW